MHHVYLEAAGCITTGYLIKAVHEAGYRVIASDLDEDIAARMLADDFFTLPPAGHEDYWDRVTEALIKRKVDVVFPSLHETLLGWSQRKEQMRAAGIHVILSDPGTISVCQDKWLTYQHFIHHQIPTPATSLRKTFPLVKPRFGRGGKGITMTEYKISMEGMISQAFVEGQEYTVDVFCDRDHVPQYIIPRKRLRVQDGKSTVGMTVHHPQIINWVKEICLRLPFVGPLNIQCFESSDGDIRFIEINPRVAGGMALGFAASQNWLSLAIDHFVHDQTFEPNPVQWGLKMMRFYEEVFIMD